MRPQGEIEMVTPDIFSRKDTEHAWLAKDCMRRAALSYEQAEMWREAADCWSEADEAARAAEIYLRLNDYEQSASLLRAAGRYSEARAQYEAWHATLRPEDAVARVKALLGISLCLLRMKLQHTARGHYLRARAIIESEALQRDALTNGCCWELLAEYGLEIERDDIVQVAYEKALVCYGPQYNAERVRTARAFLKAVKGNRLLAEELTERLSEWSLSLPVVDRTEVEPGRHAAFIARGRAGNISDVDYLMHTLESEPRMAMTRLVDYALGLVQTTHGEERIKHYLFEGTETQRNYAALYFKRLGRKRQALLGEAFNQGKISRVQAFAE
jgi:tetratricopeptide (TPR) repeat protein